MSGGHLQILMRFSTHDSRAENSIRFVGIALDWTIVHKRLETAAQQSNLF